MQLKFFAGLFVAFAGVAYAVPQGSPAVLRCHPETVTSALRPTTAADLTAQPTADTQLPCPCPSLHPLNENRDHASPEAF
ncbi:hypothetical protein D9613_006568 [Agrocybe pediades]|uniref:Uncharacterized protein n=1 Tax=Agrocybe pediades TaxID=84607 RepID=A0A8H4VIK8_9AGAR|nr:hypothetical protein D9613_006568 [Agrocybe pediades]